MDGSRAVATPGTRVFVGRTAERTLLRHLLRDAAHGRPAMVVVSGVPGAGKTALLEWTAGAAASLGAEVLRVAGYQSALPFATLGRLVAPFPELVDAVRAAEAGTRHAAHADAAAPDTPSGSVATSDLARVLVDAMGARARRRVLAVLLDDVQDLGDASSAVLDDTFAGLDDAGVRHPLKLFVLVTVREPLAETGLAQHMLRLGAARALTLEGLDDRDVFEFIQAIGQRPTPSVVRELVEDTGGLPLLIESEVEQRRGSAGRQTWTTRPRVGDVRVRSISDALKLRLEKVDEVTRQMLRHAAALGEPWSPAELAIVVERPSAEIEVMTALAEQARLVAHGREGIRFAHPLVRSELLDRLPNESRCELHRSIARRLRAWHEGRGTFDDEVAVRVADHLLRSGPDVPTAELAETALRAGRVAMGWTAWGQASRFLMAAAEASVESQSPGELARRHLEAGRAAYYDHDSRLAESLLARAISLAREAGDRDVQLAAATTVTYTRLGAPLRPGDKVDVSELEAALSVPAGDLSLVVGARAALAEALFVSAETDRALDIVASTRLAASDHGRARAIDDSLSRVEFTEGIHRLSRFELTRADECFARGRAHATAADNAVTDSYCSSRLALSQLMQGHVRAACSDLAAVNERAMERAFWGDAGFTAAQMAFAGALAGRDDALELADLAYRLWRRTGYAYTGALLAPVLGALTARTRGIPRDAQAKGSLPFPADDLPESSAHAALATVEANDVSGAWATVSTARWRHGFRGEVTINNDAVAVALVEVGDLIGDSSLVGAGRAPLEEMYERGVVISLGWPTTVPRLLAIGARHDGDVKAGRRFLDHAFSLVTREKLPAERAKALLELGRVSSLEGRPTTEVESLITEAARSFDEQSMHGWVARCEATALELGVSLGADAPGIVVERTVFTDDVVASTPTNARLGDALYVEQLRTHDRLVRARLREFGGREIKHTGDGLNAVFEDPADAMRCALGARADFDRWHMDEPELALQIRCGLARGRLVPSGGDFFGLVQAEAARLCSIAKPGEVLASGDVLEGVDAPAFGAESLGRHALRGLPARTEVYRLSFG